MTRATNLPGYIERFQRRVLYDALLEATCRYWNRRADTFAKVGTPTCDLIAHNCRRHAQLLAENGLDDAATAVLDDMIRARRRETAP